MGTAATPVRPKLATSPPRPPRQPASIQTAKSRHCGSTPLPAAYRYARSHRRSFRVPSAPSRLRVPASFQIRPRPRRPHRSRSPSSPSESRLFARQKLQRQHAHPDQIRAVNALEALGDHAFTPSSKHAFRRPVARRARAVFFARDDQQRRAFLLIPHRRHRR